MLDKDKVPVGHGAKVEIEPVQLDVAIAELHNTTESLEQLVRELHVKLEPVLLEEVKSDPSDEIELPQTCAIGREIRRAISRIRQVKEECAIIFQTLDV